MIRTTILWLIMLAYPLLSGPLYRDLVLMSGGDVDAAESIPQMERRLLDMANAERAKVGAPPLKWSNNLALAARLHSDEMVRHNQLSHQFKDEPELGGRLAQQGARFDANAENVGYAGGVEELHSGWMNSQLHRANLLNPKYDEMGVGIARAGDRLFGTQDFGHAVAKYSSDQGATEVADAYTDLRRKVRLQPLRVAPSSSLESIACKDQASANIGSGGGSRFVGQRYIYNYTTSDLKSFPATLRDRLADPNVKNVEVGVCGRQDVVKGFSGYRVVAVLY